MGIEEKTLISRADQYSTEVKPKEIGNLLAGYMSHPPVVFSEKGAGMISRINFQTTIGEKKKKRQMFSNRFIQDSNDKASGIFKSLSCFSLTSLL